MPSQQPRVRKPPSHWLRNRRRAAVLVLLVMLAVTFLARDLGRADALDSYWLRVRFTLRELIRPPAHSDPDIVLVNIDDRSLHRWREPIVGWGGHLADAIDRLNDSGARVVAVDWTQPEPVDRWFPGTDQKLAEALSRSRSAVLVQALRWDARAKHRSWIRPYPELLWSLPGAHPDPDVNLGFAELQRDSDDSIVSSVRPFLPLKAAPVSFAGRVVEHYRGSRWRGSGRTWRLDGNRSIALREDGTVLVNYAGLTGRVGAFEHYSLEEVATLPRRPDPRFRDKIVLIGASFSGSNEQHYVPFLDAPATSRKAFGVSIQANLIRTLLDGKPIREGGRMTLWALAAALGILGTAAFAWLSWGAAVLLCAGVAAAWCLLSLNLFVTHGYALPVVLPLAGLFLGGGGMGIYRALWEERERLEVLRLWGRYQDPRIVDYLLRHPQARGGDGRAAEATVLFADLKDFTRSVESLSPDEALQRLNRYLGVMNEVIREHGGFIDKYLGDGLMAKWGAPEVEAGAKPRAEHAQAAVRACLELRRRVEALSHSLGEERATFGLRLTVHTGPVVVGWVGAEQMEFTIIGDTVNVTARMQETAKHLGCDFLVSESTHELVGPLVVTGQQAEVAIRGRQQRLRVYEVLAEQSHGEPAGVRLTPTGSLGMLPAS